MDKYIINITESAIEDMEDIYKYIAYELFEPENAKVLYNRIANAILTLDIFPERYHIFNSKPEHSLKIIKVMIDNFSMLYC